MSKNQCCECETLLDCFHHQMCCGCLMCWNCGLLTRYVQNNVVVPGHNPTQFMWNACTTPYCIRKGWCDNQRKHNYAVARTALAQKNLHRYVMRPVA